MSWVRIELRGTISGRRLAQMGQQIHIKRVRLLRGGAQLDVQAKDVNVLRGILRGAGLHMKVIKRYGLLRVRVSARRRAGVVASILCAALVLWGLSQTLFAVWVTGAKDAVQQQMMMDLLESYGIRPGMYAGNLPKDAVARDVMASFPGLTYAAVRRRGLGAELYVVQATAAPEVYDPNTPVDVVATTGGLVTKVVALSGEALVKAGDTVIAGQVLIQGTERMPHARGAVTARIWSVGKGTAELVLRESVPTGREQVCTRLRSGAWSWPEEKASGFAEEEIQKETFDVLDGMFYPLEIERVTFCEVETHAQKRDTQLVKDESGARAMTDALTKLPNGACVVDKRIEYSMIKDGKLSATATLESVLQIGEEREIAFPNE